MSLHDSTILSTSAVVCYSILCLPVIFLSSQRYLEHSTQCQSDKGTSNTSRAALCLHTTSALPLRNHRTENPTFRAPSNHHHIAHTTLPSTRNGTWCTVYTHFLIEITSHATLKFHSIFRRSTNENTHIRTSQPHAKERDKCGLAVPAAQHLAQAAAANAVATAPAARVVLSTALGVSGFNKKVE